MGTIVVIALVIYVGASFFGVYQAKQKGADLDVIERWWIVIKTSARFFIIFGIIIALIDYFIGEGAGYFAIFAAIVLNYYISNQMAFRKYRFKQQGID